MPQTEDRGTPAWLVLATLALLGLFSYLTTDWMTRYPWEALLRCLKLLDGLGFTSIMDGEHLSNDLWMVWYRPENGMSYDEQRRLLFGTVALGFLSSCYLPRTFKRASGVVVTVLCLTLLVGGPATTLLLSTLGVVYLVFHKPSPTSPPSLLFTILTTLVFLYHGISLGGLPGAMLLILGLGLYPTYFQLHRSSNEVYWSRARTMSVHSCWLVLGSAVVVQVSGREFAIPLGLILSFWLWERLVFYALDFRDGEVPEELGWWGFYATFLSPAFLVNMSWLNRIGKGYVYLQDQFLARDQGLVVRSGLRLLLVSLLFLLLKMPLLDGLWLLFRSLEVDPMSLQEATARVERQMEVSPGSVWCALLTDFLGFYLTWSVIGHFKVGVWRLMGYDILPYFQYPFLSTNLVELWRRYSYYYREFLLAAFYYPVFLALRGRPRWLRTVVATLAAATYGNFLFHLLEALLYSEAQPASVWQVARTLPYFIIFGLAIALTSLYLGRRSERKPSWTEPRRYWADILAMLLTFGFYIVVRILRNVPAEHSYSTTWKLLGGAFGLS